LARHAAHGIITADVDFPVFILHNHENINALKTSMFIFMTFYNLPPLVYDYLSSSYSSVAKWVALAKKKKFFFTHGE